MADVWAIAAAYSKLVSRNPEQKSPDPPSRPEQFPNSIEEKVSKMPIYGILCGKPGTIKVFELQKTFP
jgi:hypothetical protein